MTTGIIFPAYASEVVWAAVSGAWSADYPLANVTDLIRPSKVARATASGARTLGGVFPAARWLRAIALVHHNIPAGVLMRVYGFSGTGNDPTADAGAMVYDSGSIQVWPSAGPIAGYRSNRPVLLSAPTLIRSVRIIINDPGTALELGGIELGAMWEWPGVSYGRSLGVQGAESSVDLLGGAVEAGAENPALIVDGQVDLMSMGITSTTGLDFQKAMDIKAPFIWGESFETPSSWPRRCLLARNVDLPEMVGALYRHDAFPFRLKEHLR